jgi:hypothetical protein
MKHKYTLLFVTCLIFTLTACKKENNYPVIGKWQETKIRVYVTGPTGTITSDTTYSGQTFTNLDYIQFYSDGTAAESEDHEYFPTGPPYLKIPPDYLSTSSYNYTSSASGYTLTPNYANVEMQSGPPGASQTITATVPNSNSLRIHMVDTFIAPTVSTVVYDAYYTK